MKKYQAGVALVGNGPRWGMGPRTLLRPRDDRKSQPIGRKDSSLCRLDGWVRWQEGENGEGVYFRSPKVLY